MSHGRRMIEDPRVIARMIEGRRVVAVEPGDAREPDGGYLAVRLSGSDAPTLYLDAPTLYVDAPTMPAPIGPATAAEVDAAVDALDAPDGACPNTNPED